MGQVSVPAHVLTAFAQGVVLSIIQIFICLLAFLLSYFVFNALYVLVGLILLGIERGDFEPILMSVPGALLGALVITSFVVFEDGGRLLAYPLLGTGAICAFVALLRGGAPGFHRAGKRQRRTIVASAALVLSIAIACAVAPYGLLEMFMPLWMAVLAGTVAGLAAHGAFTVLVPEAEVTEMSPPSHTRGAGEDLRSEDRIV